MRQGLWRVLSLPPDPPSRPSLLSLPPLPPLPPVPSLPSPPPLPSLPSPPPPPPSIGTALSCPRPRPRPRQRPRPRPRPRPHPEPRPTACRWLTDPARSFQVSGRGVGGEGLKDGQLYGRPLRATFVPPIPENVATSPSSSSSSSVAHRSPPILTPRYTLLHGRTATAPDPALAPATAIIRPPSLRLRFRAPPRGSPCRGGRHGS